jgi:hypothetical protein
VAINPGVKVQSLPGPGELPQTYETVEEIEARPEWNAIPARAATRRPPAMGDTDLFLQGVTTNLQVGDPILLVGKERLEDPTSDRWDVRTVSSVRIDQDAGITRVTWQRPLGGRTSQGVVLPAAEDVRVHALRQRASLFGHNAPDWAAMPDEVRQGYLDRVDEESANDWPTMCLSRVGTSDSETNPADTIFLDRAYPQIVGGGWLVLSAPAGEGAENRELYGIESSVEGSRTDFTLSSKTSALVLSGENLSSFELHIRDATVLAQSEELALSEAPILDPVQGDRVDLGIDIPHPPEGRTVVVRGRRARVAVAAGVRDLLLQPEDGSATVELNPGEELGVLKPFTEAADDRVWTVEHESGVRGTVVAGTGDLPIVPAGEDDPLLVELAEIAASEGEAGVTGTLPLAAPLANSFDRASFAASANVAWATHGESKTETLGSGDASRAFQRFTLKESPLTYIPASTPTGGETTLSVRVNDVLWAEVPSLLGRSPRERVYVVRVGDDGKAVIEFGDGETGARVPTGAENVSAVHRVGTGLAGAVGAGKLTLLASRPLGVKGVTNPLPATGAADPESRDRARENAPLTVLTLDRVVSLQDHEDFARAFSGVGKAGAAWLWDGTRRRVHLTVAADDGTPLSPNSVTYQNLTAAIPAAGDPRLPLRIDPYEPLTFNLRAGVFVDPDHRPEDVLDRVRAALLDTFSFERRAFGQWVAQSEVVAVMQQVEGVVAVDVMALHRTGTTVSVQPVLPANLARKQDGTVHAAQLLTVNSATLELEARP